MIREAAERRIIEAAVNNDLTELREAVAVLVELRGPQAEGRSAVYDKAQQASLDAKAIGGVLNRLAETSALLAELTDPDPCRFDHHGYCQAHGYFETEPKCPHARAKDLLLSREKLK